MRACLDAEVPDAVSVAEQSRRFRSAEALLPADSRPPHVLHACHGDRACAAGVGGHRAAAAVLQLDVQIERLASPGIPCRRLCHQRGCRR